MFDIQKKMTLEAEKHFGAKNRSLVVVPPWWDPADNESYQSLLVSFALARKRREDPLRRRAENSDTQLKWNVGQSFAEVHERVGPSPVSVTFSGKTFRDKEHKYLRFLERFHMATMLMGGSCVTGGGWGGMGISAHAAMRALSYLTTARLEPLICHFRPRVIVHPINMEMEPLAPWYTDVTEPATDLYDRTKGLDNMGIPLMHLCMTGGDSTLFEVYGVVANNKGGIKRCIATPFKHHCPKVGLVDENPKFYRGFMRQQKDMAERAESDRRRQRKLNEYQKLEGLHVNVNDPDSPWKLVLAWAEVYERVYGVNPIELWEIENDKTRRGRTLIEAAKHFCEELDEDFPVIEAGEPESA